MLVRVKIDQLETLRDLEVETHGDTLVPILLRKIWKITSTVLSLEQIEKDLLDPESETTFVLNEDQEICGFQDQLGSAQTEPVEMDKSFEIQRIYVKKECRAGWLGREFPTLRWIKPRVVALRGHCGCMGTQLLRRKIFTIALDLNDLVNTRTYRRYRGYRLVVAQAFEG